MRIIYNTSFILNEEIEDEWIGFMQEHYIPALHQNNLCKDVIFTRVAIEQPEGKTYSVQIIFENKEQQQQFLENDLPHLEEKIIRKYASQYVCFSSLLTEI